MWASNFFHPFRLVPPGRSVTLPPKAAMSVIPKVITTEIFGYKPADKSNPALPHKKISAPLGRQNKPRLVRHFLQYTSESPREYDSRRHCCETAKSQV